ncbi:MAG: chemotaxis protein CheW [Nitrospirae bacterium]|nr:chemotaxis protein CheW [Nitrospirota bacterium]
MPYICLNELFHETNQGGKCAHLVIVHYAGQKVALAADNLLGDIQVVIKSLGKMYKDLDGVSGATILGDGAVALVIDVPGIIKMFQITK